MKNSFKSNIEANKAKIAAIEATELAKQIPQYTATDVYKLIKDKKGYAIVAADTIIGFASSKEEADFAVDFLQHFTDGKPLTADNLYKAMNACQAAVQKGYDIASAEADGTLKVDKTYKINNRDYVVDDTNELYTLDGQHICNIADIVDAKKNGALSDELFLEILTSRINKR